MRTFASLFEKYIYPRGVGLAKEGGGVWRSIFVRVNYSVSAGGGGKRAIWGGWGTAGSPHTPFTRHCTPKPVVLR
jgi:hypothetical protein